MKFRAKLRKLMPNSIQRNQKILVYNCKAYSYIIYTTCDWRARFSVLEFL